MNLNGALIKPHVPPFQPLNLRVPDARERAEHQERNHLTFGWAALFRCGNHVREVTGGELATTNNRMELQAAISALKSLKEK